MRYILIVIILCAACSKPSEQPAVAEMPPAPVLTAKVEVRDVPLHFEAMGTIQPYQTAEVVPQVRGMITKVHFNEGKWVEEGDLLYTIEEASYAIRVLEMQATLAQNQAHLLNAQKKLQRYQSLSQRDLIAQVEWDELETKITLYESIVKADEARLAAAQLDLSHCKIVAPIAGYACKTVLHAGNMATGTPLVTIVQEEPFYVDFAITEQELAHLSPSTPLSVEVYRSGSDECLGKGRVTFLDHRIDLVSGMLPARAQLASVLLSVWAGQPVRVHLVFGNKKSAQLIPQRAVKTNQSGAYVFSVKEDNTVESRTVKLGPEDKGMIVVEEGLDGANKVVIEGHARLFPGSKVEEK